MANLAVNYNQLYNTIKRGSIISLVIFLFIYIFLRAYYLSFTHDECLSFQIITGNQHILKTANNHILNTKLMFAFYKLFGGSEIILRLPNILAFIMYSFFSYKILVKIDNIFLVIFGASLLLINPYLLDYFSLARGYGLSIAFGMGALYFLLNKESANSYNQLLTNLSLSFIFSTLAAYSNLNCINFNIAMMIIYSIELYFLISNVEVTRNKKVLYLIASVYLVNIVFLYFLINQVFFLRANNELYFGGKNNFIDDTLTILIHRSIYFSYYGEQQWKFIRVMIIAVFLLASVYQFCNQKYTRFTKILIILLLMIYATILQHYMFDSLYPTERTALIFIPLFALFIIYLLSNIYSEIHNKQFVVILLNLFLILFLSLPLIWHFKNNVNLKITKEWVFDADTKTMMGYINEKSAILNNKDKKITMSCNWEFEPSINYYREIYSMDFLEKVNRDGISKSTDFIFCKKDEKEKIDSTDCYIILNNYKSSGTLLMKKSICN